MNNHIEETNMNNSPISVKQDPKRSQEPGIDIELYSEGLFDGLCNLESTKPHIYDYWQGHQLGQARTSV